MSLQEMTAYAVDLEPYELAQAAYVGCQRHIESVAKGLPDRYGAEKGGWNLHIEGAAGELAFAKCLNVYWSGSVNTFGEGGDVGQIQVRTRSRHDYELIIREKDRDDDVFVLVTGVSPEYVVVGWTFGGIAKAHDEWRKTHGGRAAAWFVPHEALRPVDELYEVVA
ncbi:hypothetical protein [Candidatus Solirubrobacter pratensis]|uniref:hypothetical protein n=1 Tax=Candidatus Solirubrobacter pratensis TaxID=1298857 RepID=UPI000688C2E7|nr:hypothetical protein [Candidatus Solirubrobacter pratensis]